MKQAEIKSQTNLIVGQRFPVLDGETHYNFSVEKEVVLKVNEPHFCCLFSHLISEILFIYRRDDDHLVKLMDD